MLREPVRDLNRRERLTLYEGLQILDEISGWLQASDGVCEYNAVSDCAVVRDNIGQHQRRFGDCSAAVLCGCVIGTHTARTRSAQIFGHAIKTKICRAAFPPLSVRFDIS